MTKPKPKIKQTEQQKLSDETVLLLQVLASVDVLFCAMPPPDRGTANSCCAEIFVRQQQFLRGEGIRWTIGGNQTERKAGERVLSELRESGFIVLPRQRGSRRNVSLTARGDDVARMLVGHPTAADAWLLLQAIVEAVADRRGVGPDGPGIWLLEKQLVVGDDGDVDAVREMVLPLIVRGYVSNGIDVDGGQYFTATAAGKEASLDPPPWPEDDIELMPEALEIYEDAYGSFRKDRDGWRAAPGHIFIPFPAR